jgi:hypothetical protein
MEIEYGLLDLYHLFVEVIFGHFLLSILGIAAVFTVICFLMKMSQILVIIIISLFMFMMMVGYFGSIIGIFIFTLSATFFAYSIVRWVQGWYVS